MPWWLAEQFARAWDAGRFRCGLTGKPNDEDDWIRFVGEYTDVYVRHLDKKLTMSTPASTHFLIIKMGSMNDTLSFIVDLEINLQTIQYKHEADVFFYDTYQFQAPHTPLVIHWETTSMPDVPKVAFDCDFELVDADDRYPPAIFPEVWRKPSYSIVAE
jgi:hypothetical protein